MSRCNFMKEFSPYEKFNGSYRILHFGLSDAKIVVCLMDDEVSVLLHSIAANVKGHGAGSAGLKWLCDLATMHGVRIVGWIEHYDGKEGLTKTQLAAWYKRHGFTVTRKYGLDGKYSTTDIEFKGECREQIEKH